MGGGDLGRDDRLAPIPVITTSPANARKQTVLLVDLAGGVRALQSYPCKPLNAGFQHEPRSRLTCLSISILLALCRNPIYERNDDEPTCVGWVNKVRRSCNGWLQKLTESYSATHPATIGLTSR